MVLCIKGQMVKMVKMINMVKVVKVKWSGCGEGQIFKVVKFRWIRSNDQGYDGQGSILTI